MNLETAVVKNILNCAFIVLGAPKIKMRVLVGIGEKGILIFTQFIIPSDVISIDYDS